ncbi:S-adenosyl-L-methionine-dependent methyltransferase [Abortiporus biennis]|nr:S-adenosyl-L-methionine-dependent methyltransferase [Abortiporus biennis]
MTSPQEQVRAIIAQDNLNGWETAWKENLTPWDAGDVQPPLKDLIESKRIPLPTTGRALVPGCGRGYDPIFIASSLGLHTLALDISQTAVDAAATLFDQLKETLAPNVDLAFETRDFFTFALSQEEPEFDLVYDYTFFVAIPPARRVEWGNQMTSLTKPGSYLITLVFPIVPPHDLGPPFFVRPEHYSEVLSADHWEVVLKEIPVRSSETHKGREELIVWKRK